MMVLKVFFSAEEIKQFFTENGYTVIETTFGRWDKAYHNRSEYVDYIADAVVINNKFIEASKLFEKISEYRIKRMITPANIEMKRLIETTFKHLLKNN